MNRRRLLAVSAAALTAGCVGGDRSAPPADSSSRSPTPTDSPSRTPPRDEPNSLLGQFRLRNATDETRQLSLTVEEGGETLLDVEFSLSAGGRRRFDDVITTRGRYRFQVGADTGVSDTYAWDIPHCDDSDYLVVRYRTDGFDFTERHHTIDPPPTCARW
jgi:hypothetical protein